MSTIPDDRHRPVPATDHRILTPAQWEAELGVQVIDPDGWRADGASLDTPVSRSVFATRAAASTTRTTGDIPWWTLAS